MKRNEKMNIKKTLSMKLVSMLSLSKNKEELFDIVESVLTNLMEYDNIADIIDKFKSTYSYDEILNEISEVYMKYFTEDELIDIINFYTSNSGQKLLKNQASIISDIMDVNNKYCVSISEEILKKNDKF